jgi:hypothetical protein
MTKNIYKINITLFFSWDAADTKNKKMNDVNTEKLEGTLKK